MFVTGIVANSHMYITHRTTRIHKQTMSILIKHIGIKINNDYFIFQINCFCGSNLHTDVYTFVKREQAEAGGFSLVKHTNILMIYTLSLL